MLPVKCPSCGANVEIDENREFGFCNYCGTKIIQEKIVVEHRGEVSIDNTEAIKNLFVLARRAKDNEEYEKAVGFYNDILLKDPTSWEACFYSCFLDLFSLQISEIESACKKIENCVKESLQLLKTSVIEKEQVEKCLADIASDLCAYVLIGYNYSKSYYKANLLQGNSTAAFYSRAKTLNGILYSFGDSIVSVFGDDFADATPVNVWEEAIKNSKTIINEFGLISEYVNVESEIIKTYANKIKKYEPNYNIPIINVEAIKKEQYARPKKYAVIILVIGIVAGICLFAYAKSLGLI